jgi:hypothetical protein
MILTERIRETVNFKVGDAVATIRTRDRHISYEARQAGLFQEVEAHTVRLFDAAGAFLGERAERLERGLYRVARADETAAILVVLDPARGPISLVHAE